MLNKTYFWILLLFFCFSIFSVNAEEDPNTFTISGQILTASTHEAVSFATIKIENYNIYSVCDINGNFEITNLSSGKYILEIQCIGYIPKKHEITVNGDITSLVIYLDLSSYDIEQINIMATQTKGDKVKVDEAAIEYIQPISIQDVLLLLPGNVHETSDITSFTQNTSRQAGHDGNTSLGVGLVSDGAPVTNDAMRTQMIGITANTNYYNSSLRYAWDGAIGITGINANDMNDYYYGNSETSSRTGSNQGIDMRHISTDHIESIEFQKGISSAKHGNLSSGLMTVNSKKGISPLRIRIKSDLRSTLAYIGKGIKLSEKLGSLHVGVDFLNSNNDPREELNDFSRVTGQVYYKNQVLLGSKKLDLDIKLSETLSLNRQKKDELVYEYNEKYKGDYSRTSLLFKGKFDINHKLLDELEFVQSANITNDKITRHRWVRLSSGPRSTPISFEEGEHEGMYLANMYYSDFNIENIPFYSYSQLNAISRFNIGKKINTNILYGIENSLSKNFGDGAVMEDPLLPPYPENNTYMRPRANHEIPAIIVGAAYLEANLLYNIKDDNFLKLSVGGRTTQMFNLPDNYRLNNRWITEPRINLSYSHKTGKGFDALTSTIRMGYGHENKLPTLDYLYPEKIYKDFYVLNAYTLDPQYRRLIVLTQVYDVENPDLIENCNKKYELGADFEYKNYLLSLTLFNEESTTGFSYSNSLYPLIYTKYEDRIPGIDISNRKPERTDYYPEEYAVFPEIPTVKNNQTTSKKGFEYRLVFPRIDALHTRIEINGAYYESEYGTTDPFYYYKDIKVADEAYYPYAGIYFTNPKDIYKRFNTNFWFNTHIPRFKLMITNFFQFIWINSNQFQDNHNPYPSQYLSADGEIHDVTDEVIKTIENDLYWRHLKIVNDPLEDYGLNKEPVSILWNVKATKEFGKHVRLSFFVDNIIDINPIYINSYNQEDRNWQDPFFGFELILNLR